MSDIDEPLFTARINSNGQITIRRDVRERKNLNPGDLVDVFDIRLRLPPQVTQAHNASHR